MNRRSLLILAAGGVLLVWVLLLQSFYFTREGPARDLHAPGLADRLDDLESLRIIAAGNRVVATVQRGDQGWVVAEKGGHPVDFERFRGSLRALSQARRVEKKTAVAEFYSRLGVEDPDDPDAAGYLLELDFGDEHPSEGFIVGNRAGNNMAYVRTAGEEQSWLVSADFDLSEQTRDWLDREIIDLSSPTVRRVVLDRGPGSVLEIARGDSGDINFTPLNIPEGRELSYGSVANSIGSALANVEANDVLSAADVNELPQAVLARYETFDGLVVELDVREDAPLTADAGNEGTLPSQGEEADEEDDPRYWVLFTATVNQPPPEEPAADGPAEAEAEGGGGADEEAGAPELSEQDEPQATAAEQARGINSRLAGWAYELPQYKSDQWFKKMEDLLKEE